MANDVPVVYLAFANELDDHLQELKNESRAIFRALQGLEKDSKIRVHREESSQIDELHQDLLAYDQDIVIFHYGGHADGSMLQLEGGRGSAGGLAKMLGQQKSLKLVFLNGCATKDQVRLLHQAGVPAVIATSVKINDSKATIFSTAFYQAIANGHSIAEAFDSARNLLETKFSGSDIFDIQFNRFPAWDDDEEAEQELSQPTQGLEWALYVRAEAQTDIDQWRLTSAQSEWQVQLRDTHGVIRSAIDDEPLSIPFRAVQRNLNAGVCTSCGTVLLSAKSGESATSKCPACLSEHIEKGTASTSLPDKMLDFAVTQKKASAIARAAFDISFKMNKKSGEMTVEQPVAVWAPFWMFNGSVVAEYEGESAFPTGITEGKAKLDWRTASGGLNQSLESLLVPASRAPVSGVDIDHADVESFREYSSDDSAELSLPTDKNIEAAFVEASSTVQQHLDAEIKERLGGVEQRNIKSKIRYDNLDAKLVWLPNWIVSAKFNDQTSVLVVNGQTGSVTAPRMAGLAQINDEVKKMIGRKTFSMGDEPTKFTLLASLFGGVGIGLMVGLLLGLAAPSGPDQQNTVSIFIGAVGVALAALLGLNDKHFSIAKGIRIGSFGLTVALSAPLGIYLRANDILSPIHGATVVYQPAPSLASGQSQTGAGAGVITTLRGHQVTALFADSVELTACNELQNEYENERTAEQLISNFAFAGSGWDKFAKEVAKNVDQPHQKAALLRVRDALCGSGDFEQAVTLDKEGCADLLPTVRRGDSDSILTRFDHHQLSDAANLVTAGMDSKNRTATLGLLAELMCASQPSSAS